MNDFVNDYLEDSVAEDELSDITWVVFGPILTIYIYIYIDIYREREGNRDVCVFVCIWKICSQIWRK